MNKIFVILLIAGLTLGVVPLEVTANTSRDGADFLVKLGEGYLKEGQTQTAIHEFSKALMLDPSHKKAREHLAKYGIADGLYSGTQTNASRIAGLAGEVKEANAQADYLLEEQKIHSAKVKRMKAERRAISKDLSAKNAEVYRLRDEIAKLQEAMDLKDDVLVDKARKQEAIATEIKAVSKRQQAEAKRLHMDAEELALVHQRENELLALQARYNRLREESLGLERRYDNLHSTVESYALVRSTVIEDYTDEVIDKDIALLDVQHHFISTLEDEEYLNSLLQLQRERLDRQHDLMIKQHEKESL